MPDVARAIRVLENELECCKRPCARDECGKCDLVMDADWLAGGLADAIELLKAKEPDKTWTIDEVIELLIMWEPEWYSESETKWLMNKAAKLLQKLHDKGDTNGTIL